jgi:hypothetical protein
LMQRRQQWEEAARHTPHGQPIRLQSSDALAFNAAYQEFKDDR